MPIELVIFDCDLTLWDHHNVTGLAMPFRKVGPDSVEDANDVRVTLFPAARETLDGLRDRGVLISACTWNQPDPVFSIFDLLEIRGYFTHPMAEPHPGKHKMIKTILDELSAEGRQVPVENALYIDDRRLHLDDIYKQLGPIRFLQYAIDIADLRDVLAIVDRAVKVETRNAARASAPSS